MAAQVKRDTQIPVAAVGMINSPRLAEYIIGSEQADVVLIGREVLRNPSFALHWARELNTEVDYAPPHKWHEKLITTLKLAVLGLKPPFFAPKLQLLVQAFQAPASYSTSDNGKCVLRETTRWQLVSLVIPLSYG